MYCFRCSFCKVMHFQGFLLVFEIRKNLDLRKILVSCAFILSKIQILNRLYGPYGPGSRSQSVYFKAKPQCICLSCVISWIFHNIFSPYKWIWERKFIGCVIIFVKIFKSRRLFFSLFSLFLNSQIWGRPPSRV